MLLEQIPHATSFHCNQQVNHVQQKKWLSNMNPQKTLDFFKISPRATIIIHIKRWLEPSPVPCPRALERPCTPWNDWTLTRTTSFEGAPKAANFRNCLFIPMDMPSPPTWYGAKSKGERAYCRCNMFPKSMLKWRGKWQRPSRSVEEISRIWLLNGLG